MNSAKDGLYIYTCIYTHVYTHIYTHMKGAKLIKGIGLPLMTIKIYLSMYKTFHFHFSISYMFFPLMETYHPYLDVTLTFFRSLSRINPSKNSLASHLLTLV